MPDEPRERRPLVPLPMPPAPEPPHGGPTINIGEEYGTAAKNLPPARIVLVALIVVLVIAAIAAFVQRPQSSATGAIDDVNRVEIPNQNSVMVALNVTVDNRGKKPYWIHTIDSEVETDSGKLTDQAAPAVDYERYFTAFPALKEHALTPLKRETMIVPGA